MTLSDLGRATYDTNTMPLWPYVCGGVLGRATYNLYVALNILTYSMICMALNIC